MSLTNNAIHYKTSALIAAPQGPDKKRAPRTNFSCNSLNIKRKLVLIFCKKNGEDSEIFKKLKKVFF